MKNLNHTQKQFDFESMFQNQVLTDEMMYRVKGGDGWGSGVEDPPPPPEEL